jgi:flagellar motor switch protein FliM
MDESLSQNDLDALFGDLQAEIKKPREVKEVKAIESLENNEVLSQDQIDELLKSFQSS